MKPQHHVIIGNGVAANRAAIILRENDENARISLISREFFLFYFRHKLPAYVVGDIGESALQVHSIDHYQTHRIRLRLGQTVQKVDLNNRILYLKHMEKLHYDKLLICSGGAAAIPEIYHPFRASFTALKGLSDARKLRDRLAVIRRVVIVGGDLPSVRLGEKLIRTGRDVCFILDDHAFWPLETAPDIRAVLEARLHEMGARVITDDPLARIDTIQSGAAADYEVVTRSGESIRAQMVGAFFGFKPDVDFLIRSGLDIDRGILVDEHLQTPFPDVYAAGDCAQVYAPEMKNYWVSVGWKNAFYLGETAARNILGGNFAVNPPSPETQKMIGTQLQTAWWLDLDGRTS